MPCTKIIGTVALDHKILKSYFQQGTQWMELLRGAQSWAGRSSALSFHSAMCRSWLRFTGPASAMEILK